MRSGPIGASLAGRELRASEILAAAWRERYVRGDCDIEEMEAGVERALKGEYTDREWIDLARERHAVDVSPSPPSLTAIDSVLKSMYRGPVS